MIQTLILQLAITRLLLFVLFTELPTDVNIFADPISDPNAHAQKRYFRYLTADPDTDEYIYVGGM
jgi:hypothetical protein